MTDEEVQQLRNKIAEISRELEEPNMNSSKRQHLENQLLHYQFQAPIKIVQQESDQAAGLGDPLLGVKWRFLSDEKSQVQLGVYPQVLLPVGDHRRDLGEGQAAYLLPFLAQKGWEKWTLYGEAGYWWQTAPERRNFGSPDPSWSEN
jgi:outer membrane putative beta-barrel porin/alpha-amylase